MLDAIVPPQTIDLLTTLATYPRLHAVSCSRSSLAGASQHTPMVRNTSLEETQAADQLEEIRFSVKHRSLLGWGPADCSPREEPQVR